MHVQHVLVTELRKTFIILMTGLSSIIPGSVQDHANRRWLPASRPSGQFGEDNVRYNDAALARLRQGEFLIRNFWLSFEPTRLGWMKVDSYRPEIPLGEVVRDIAVWQVVESLHTGFRAGRWLHVCSAGRITSSQTDMT